MRDLSNENVARNWLERHGLEAFGGSISQEDLRFYFNTAKSRVYVEGLFIEYEYFFFFIIIIKFNYFCFIEINSIISNYRILEKVG